MRHLTPASAPPSRPARAATGFLDLHHAPVARCSPNRASITSRPDVMTSRSSPAGHCSVTCSTMFRVTRDCMTAPFDPSKRRTGTYATSSSALDAALETNVSATRALCRGNHQSMYAGAKTLAVCRAGSTPTARHTSWMLLPQACTRHRDNHLPDDWREQKPSEGELMAGEATHASQSWDSEAPAQEDPGTPTLVNAGCRK